MTLTKKCPQCGSDDLYLGEGRFVGHAGNVFTGLRGHPVLGMVSVQVNDCVCGQCGYVMFFLKDEELAEVRNKWKRVE